MKKVLIVFDGPNFSEGAFQFAAALNSQNPILATAVFMPQVDNSILWSAVAAGGAGAAGVFLPLIDEDDADTITANIGRFEQRAQNNLMKYRVHKNFSNFAFPELKKETRFSDVMILSEQLFLNQLSDRNRFTYLTDLIHTSECPVLVVPEVYDFPQHNILAYDGSAESAYAIKQFAYVFPELAKNETLLVYVQPDEKKEIPDMDLIEELAAQHYEDLTFFKLNIEPEKYFATWLENRSASLLISGSYGRSVISQFVRKSFVGEAVREHQVPAFISHR